MKLFKKLAAVALAAVLALSMVGCGATADIKSQINDYLDDYNMMNDSGITHNKDMDAAAEKLLAAAEEASAAGFSGSKRSLLTNEDVVAKAGITDAEKYYVSYTENYDYKSEFANRYKMQEMVSSLRYDSYNLKTGREESAYYDFEYGIAAGKIDGQEYVVMLKVPNESSPY